MKPLIKVNSCLISPPSAFALSLALVSSSGEAFSFRVTCWQSVSIVLCFFASEGKGKTAYVEERHVDAGVVITVSVEERGSLMGRSKFAGSRRKV